MTEEFDRITNETVLKIQEVLAKIVRSTQLPDYELHVVEEAITDKEEELGMVDVPSDEKFRHTIENVPGVILDIIKTEDPTGGYPGAFGKPVEQSSYPYVILEPDGSIVRRVGSKFPDREGYLPCKSPTCVSRHTFPIDYITHGVRALELLVERAPDVSSDIVRVSQLIETNANNLQHMLIEASKNRIFPKFVAFVKKLEVTAREEEYMGEVDDSEKYSRGLESCLGVILDENAPRGEVYGGKIYGPQLYPMVVLVGNEDADGIRDKTDVTIVRCERSERQGIHPYMDCEFSPREFLPDYFTYWKQAMEAISKFRRELSYVIFVDNHAGGYGYWVGDSEQDLRTRLQGEGYDDIRYGYFPSARLKRAKRLIENAIRFAPEPSHTIVNHALDDVDMILNQRQTSN